jgi:hypothetical protein
MVALCLLVGVCPRDHEVLVGDLCQRNPDFLAVEDVAVALASRGRLHADHIAACVGFREAERAEPLAPRLRREEPPLLVFVAPRH